VNNVVHITITGKVWFGLESDHPDNALVWLGIRPEKNWVLVCCW